MNTIGTLFRLTTFGESHGEAIGGVIDGCPSGVPLDFAKIEHDLHRRQGAPSQGATARLETNHVEWLSGLLDGVTLGTPIAFIVRNTDARTSDYQALQSCYRPGHADFTYEHRFGLRDWRGGGRASARETVSRVIAGSVARQLLQQKAIAITSEVALPKMDAIDDSYGGIVECTIAGVPAGVGTPVFARLNALLAAAMMSIPSAIGFEMGCGFSSTQMTCRQFGDAWQCETFPQQPCSSNHCGGVQGGISNGMPIVFRVAFHPVVTQPGGMECIDCNGRLHSIVIGGRHDRSHVPRTAVIVESMAALILADALIQQGLI